MRTIRNPSPMQRAARGVALLEVMIALTLLSVGLVGMMRLQILGITANGGARSTTFAGSSRRSSPPRSSASSRRWPAHRRLGDDPADPLRATARPGPRRDARAHLERRRHGWDAGRPAGLRAPEGSRRRHAAAFARRWSVWDWDTNTASGKAVSKVIAVSVIYKERGNPIPRELVILTHKPNAGLAVSFWPRSVTA